MRYKTTDAARFDIAKSLTPHRQTQLPARVKLMKRPPLVDLLIEHAPLLISILGAVVMLVISQTLPSVNESLMLIFGILSTLALSLVLTAYRHTYRIHSNTEELISLLAGKGSLEKNLVPYIPVVDEIKSSSTMHVLTHTLSRSMADGRGAMEQLLKRNGEICIAIMDDDAAKMAAKRSRGENNEEYFRNRAKVAAADLRAIAPSPNSTQLSVRRIGFAPSFGLYIFNKDLEDARIYIRLFGHYVSLDRNPTFLLTRKDSPLLFVFFSEQFDLAWERGVETAPATTAHPPP